MREDYLEQLDKMFPNGYLICHLVYPDNTLRMTLYNPEKDEIIEDAHRLLRNFAEENKKKGKW